MVEKGRIRGCFLLQIFPILFCIPLHILFEKKEKKKGRKKKEMLWKISNKAVHQFFKSPCQSFMAHNYQSGLFMSFRRKLLEPGLGQIFHTQPPLAYLSLRSLSPPSVFPFAVISFLISLHFPLHLQVSEHFC